MRKQACFLFLLSFVLLAGLGNAQQLNCSCSDSSLNGLTKLYIDTGDDVESREQMIEVIGKEFPHLIIVNQMEEAEIIIKYSHRVEPREGDGVKERRVEATAKVKTAEGEYRDALTYTSRATCGLHDKREARRFGRKFIDKYEEAQIKR